MPKDSKSTESKIVTPSKLKRRPIHTKVNEASIYSKEELGSVVQKRNIKPPQNYQALYPDVEIFEESNYENECETPENESPNAKFKKDFQVMPKHNLCNIDKNNHLFLIYFLSILLIFIFIIYLFYYNNLYKTKEGTSDIKLLIEETQSKFSGQTLLTYKILKTTLKRVMDENIEPSAPAVISILADYGTVSVAFNFAMYLAHSLAPHKYVVIDKTLYQEYPNEVKMKIDEKINSTLESGVLSVVVVHTVEDIPTEATMLFHSYCDHDTALFKRAVYFFIFSLDNVLPKDATPKYLDGIAIKHMQSIWKDKHSDFIGSLITRLTVSVVNIKQTLN